jgi:hypothetical protein
MPCALVAIEDRKQQSLLLLRHKVGYNELAEERIVRYCSNAFSPCRSNYRHLTRRRPTLCVKMEAH